MSGKIACGETAGNPEQSLSLELTTALIYSSLDHEIFFFGLRDFFHQAYNDYLYFDIALNSLNLTTSPIAPFRDCHFKSISLPS